MSGPSVSTHEQINLCIGLKRFRSREDLLSLCGQVSHFRERRSRLDDLLTTGRVDELSAACDVSRCTETIEPLINPRSPRHLILTSYIGHPLIVLAYGARLGIPFALLYETMADGYAEALSRLGVRLISVERRKNTVHSTLSAIETSLKDGLHLATVFDSPHDRGIRVGFLGHEIRTTYFYAMIAFDHGLPIVPLFSELSGEGVATDASATITNNSARLPKEWATTIASDLFSQLEARVLHHPEQYRWDEPSVITSTPDYLIRAAEALAFMK